jgi:hypothetical protein
VETLYYDILKLGYHLGLAIIVGGGLMVGAAAPAIFHTMRSRGEAANVFAAVLARYDGAAILALLLVASTTILRATGFEDASDSRIIIKWALLALMALATLYSVGWAGPVARAIRTQTPDFDDLPDNDMRRREFRSLHERSRRALSLAVLFGAIAIFFS